MSRFILVTGGARSGKSSFAQEFAQKLNAPVSYVATAVASDEEMRRRIEKHVQNRPREWDTVEAPYTADREIIFLLQERKTVLWDCVTVFVSNLILAEKQGEQGIEDEIVERVRKMVDSVKQSPGTLIAVTNEVGSGLVPEYEMGRHFRDIAGRVNQVLAARADEVYLVVAGIPVDIKKLGPNL